MKKVNLVHELRKSGNKVSIRHVRSFLGVHRVGDDHFMTRGEYEHALDNDEIALNILATKLYKRMPSYKDAVEPRGGWTEITLTTPDGTVTKGKYSFFNKGFCRKTGVKIALMKAMNKIGQVVPTCR